MTRQQTANWTELQSLFCRYRTGEKHCARPLYSLLLKLIKGYFRVRIDSDQDAEDLAQASILKIHFARDSYDQDKSFKTWIFTIVSRCLIDHWRGATPIAEDLDNGLEVASEDTGPDLTTEFQTDLLSAIKILKPIDQQIVYLFGIEGMTMAEIGRALGLTEMAVKLRVHRSYVRLREQLSIMSIASLSTTALLKEILQWMQ